LFGGSGSTGPTRDTWEWDGINWAQLSSTGPSFRLQASGVYHLGRQRVVLFGGYGVDSLGNTIGFNDLWEWDGANWSLLTSPSGVYPLLTVVSPHNRVYYLTLTYDYRRQRLVTYGPQWTDNGGFGGVLDWIWEWDAASGWVQQTAVQRPLLHVIKLMYDQARGRLLVTGWPVLPNGSGGGPAGVYEWDGFSPAWQLRSAPLSQTTLWSDEYDSLRSRVMRVSTDGSTWVYGPTQPAAVFAHGNGCTGSLGTPSLVPSAPWTLPWLGDSVSLDITNLPLGVAVMLMGFSDQQSGGITLPLDLGPYGMPTCFLRVADDASRLAYGAGNTATWQLGVPNSVSLLGLSFYVQAAVLDPGANTAGLTASDSVSGIVGGR